MASLEYFVVAESIAIDQATNRASAFNILEDLSASELPIILPYAVALSVWNADGDGGRDMQVGLAVTLPSGSKVDLTTNFTFRTPRHRIIQRLEGIPLTHFGEIRFEVSLNGQLQAVRTVPVRMAETGSETAPV